MDQYYARICWNVSQWMRPSQDQVRLKEKSNAAKNRFGGEEWLFSLWQFHGYHYAFLQSVKNSFRRMSGKTIDVLLWTISPNKGRFQVGEISNCEVLTNSQAKEAFEHYKKKGWIRLMQEDVARVGGNRAKFGHAGLFNVRFRSDDARQYDNPLPAVKRTDRIAGLKMYKLVPVIRSEVEKQWVARARVGSTTIPTLRPYTRLISRGATVDPYHPVLQGELMKLLRERFGKDAVIRESEWVDITVNNAKRRILIEIKTDPVAKRALREALGQILEYAYFCPKVQNSVQTELFIVAPGLADGEVSAYLSRLRNELRIPIQYCQFLPGKTLPAPFRLGE